MRKLVSGQVVPLPYRFSLFLCLLRGHRRGHPCEPFASACPVKRHFMQHCAPNHPDVWPLGTVTEARSRLYGDGIGQQPRSRCVAQGMEYSIGPATTAGHGIIAKARVGANKQTATAVGGGHGILAADVPHGH